MVDRSQSPSGSWPKLILALGALGVVVAVALWAIAIVGTPGKAREKRLDDARVSDLERIRWAIGRFHNDRGRLPTRLDELGLQEDILRDPETGSEYGYVALDAQRYELSASFTCAETEDRRMGREAEWDHPAGEHRFSFSVAEDH